MSLVGILFIIWLFTQKSEPVKVHPAIPVMGGIFMGIMILGILISY